MEKWQRNVWREALAVEGVIPRQSALLLAVGDDALMGDFPPTVLVERLAWGAALHGDMGYDRVLLLAAGDSACPDCGVFLEQAHRLVRPDGRLIIIAARPWPWHLPGTPWAGGLSARTWLRLLARNGWVVERHPTVGFDSVEFYARWLRFLPEMGLARVMVARKKPVGGSRVRVGLRDARVSGLQGA